MKIRFKKLSDVACTPKHATEDSAGCDLCASEEIDIMPGETKLVHTGLSVEIPKGHVGFLFPRSGISLRTPLRLANSVGVIDADYRGEICAMFTNTGDDRFTMAKGERMSQLVVVPYVKCEWEETESLDDTERGSGGFGHTGV
ncbi:MAG: dUTP diphosphatase [Bacteroidales bacterium]|nr:dUTP diphosphatase [Bacteroidales bacterium]